MRSTKPHVVLVPYPAQGHVTPFLQLAKLLHTRDFHVTYVNTDYNHARLLRSRGPAAVAGLDGLRFEAIPDGLPPSQQDKTQDIWRLCDATRRTCQGPFKNLVARLGQDAGVPPVTCIIADGAMGFIVHVAEELGIPAYLFFTHSACGLVGYLNFDQLVKRGYVPFKGESCFTDEYLDTRVDWIDGMLNNLRLRDLPTFIRTTDSDDVMLNINIKQCELDAPRAAGILLNTFDALEHDALAAVRARLPNTYTVGSLSSLLNASSPPANYSAISASLWKEDDRCMAWLDAQADGSVLYVNFGSIAVVTSEQMVEFACGLVAAGTPFLWVVRPDLVRGEGALLPKEVRAAVERRGLLGGWCNQEAVLGHRATGAFLSHCGWNSALESLCAGVPVICWPFFSEQVTNCRYLCDVWGVGVEMGREGGRREVEALVREVMVGAKGRAMRRRAAQWKEKAAEAVGDVGSSRANMERLVEDLSRFK